MVGSLRWTSFRTALRSGHDLRKERSLHSSELRSSVAEQKKTEVEERWRRLFSDPTQWWDHRLEKTNPRFPDFTHKSTNERLWLNGRSKPAWVLAELAAMTPRPVERSLLSWNGMLARHAKNGEYAKTLDLFDEMKREGLTPNSFTFVPVVRACAGLGLLEQGSHIHAQIIQAGCESVVFVGSALIDMYVRCGRVEDAEKVFNNLPTRDAAVWTAMIKGLVKFGQGQKALELVPQMEECVKPDPIFFVSILNACASVGALEEGRSVHAKITESGYESHTYVKNSLVDMYAKCGSIEDAWKVFVDMSSRDVVSWNAMILGLVKCGQEQKALELSRVMDVEGVKPDSVTFMAVLNACASLAALEEGRDIHQQIIRTGFDSDLFVGSSLIDMYSKCGDVGEALSVFEKMPLRDAVSWNAMINGCMRCDYVQRALELFQQMKNEQVKPDPNTCIQALHACGSLGALEEGKNVHAQIMECGWESDLHVINSLVDMYVKCGSIEDAWSVFKTIPFPDVVSWNAIILGSVKCGEGHKALELYKQMQAESVEPDPNTFVGLLNACASMGALDEGKDFHAQIIQSKCESEVYVHSSLVDMYAKCGSIEDARRVFNKMPTPDVASWNAMILGYEKCGKGEKALELYRQMQVQGVEPNHVTFVGVFSACASSTQLLEDGRHLHSQIIDSDIESHVFVLSSLIDMYCKCGSIEDAWKVFKKMPTQDLVVWTAMVLGCVKCGQVHKALEVFQQMQVEGVKPNPVTFVGILNACASIKALDEGKRIHAQIIETGWEADIFVGSSLVDMYAKCGSLENACSVFEKMPARDVAAWNAMIMGYVRCGEGQRAIELYKHMQVELVKPDSTTFVSALHACASLVALDEGKRVHAKIVQDGFEADIFVGSSLVDMYAKCGSLDDSWRVFNRMPLRDVVSWNSLLGGHGLHGLANDALQIFEQMSHECVDSNEVTFLSVLSACSHAGLVDEGVHYFEFMDSECGIPPAVEHYSCMVDLLGRAGRLEEAEDMIKRMPCKPDVAILKALLGACRVHGNLDTGERIAKQVLELDPQNASGYVLLSNIYAAAGKWESRANVQSLRIERGVKKQPGLTWIAMHDKLHSFVVNDQAHPQISEIHTELKKLSELMDEAGYVPDTHFVLHDVEEEEKVSRLYHHSEKLAIAYGLINTPPRAPIRIFKNLRVCGDCHTYTKFLSKVVDREVIVRDANRFHHFKDGLCSCRDYW